MWPFFLNIHLGDIYKPQKVSKIGKVLSWPCPLEGSRPLGELSHEVLHTLFPQGASKLPKVKFKTSKKVHFYLGKFGSINL